MAYFKSEKHFASYIRKMAQMVGLDIPYMSMEYKQIALAFYYNEILKSDDVLKVNVLEGISWRIRKLQADNNPTELEKEIGRIVQVYDELNAVVKNGVSISMCPVVLEEMGQTGKPSVFIAKGNFLEEAFKELETVAGMPGIYFLYDQNKKLVYIGRSTNLKERIPSSASERNAIYFKYMVTNNIADAFVLEPYYITVLKPPLNGEFSTIESPTVKIDVEIIEPSMDLRQIYKLSNVQEDFDLRI